jgi:hypothetical protein
LVIIKIIINKKLIIIYKFNHNIIQLIKLKKSKIKIKMKTKMKTKITIIKIINQLFITNQFNKPLNNKVKNPN